MPRALIHPRLLDRIGYLFDRTITIQERGPDVVDAFGQSQPSWPALAGHVNLPARITSSEGQEVKLPDQTYTISTHRMMLQGYYPLVRRDHRAVDDAGAIYDIRDVGWDSDRTATRLVCEVTT